MKSIVKNAIIAAAFLFGAANIANAQVKIGTSPAIIEPNSNLEVEASTNGRKIKVDKTSGQVTIADGTQGEGKVLTSDTNGGASWQTVAGCNSVEARHTGSQTVPLNDSSIDPFTILTTNTEVYDPSNAYNASTGVYTVPTTGFYSFVGSSVDNIPSINTSTRHSTLAIFSSTRGAIVRSVQQNIQYSYGTYQNVSALGYFTAGEQVTFRIMVQHVSGTKPQTTIPVSNIRFTGTRIDCNKN